MYASEVFSIIGLSLDIIGASLLAKGVFFENIKLTVDRSSQREGQYDQSDKLAIIYVGGADRIVQRCKDIFYSRIGLMILCLGFSLQILSQVLPTSCKLYGIDWFLIITILILLIIAITFLAIEMNLETKKEALSEYLNRILPPNTSISGRDWSINEKVVKKFMGENADLEYWLHRKDIEK